MARVKHSFSKQHLRAAKYFATACSQIETSTVAPTQDEQTAHRAYATNGVLSSVAFLEASVNELYLEAYDGPIQSLAGLSTKLTELLQQFWEEVERTPILHKYQTALLLAGAKRFQRGDQPYQDAESLIKLRDALVHYKPEWDDEEGTHHGLEERLRNRFAENPFGGGHPLWLPHRCLGAGCAAWTVSAAEAFSDCFCTMLGIASRT